jgi:hypothetical protein
MPDTNVIESPFATVRLRQRVTKGAGSRTKGLLMAYKLLDMAQAAGAGSTAPTSCRSSERVSSSWTASSRKARPTGRERERHDHGATRRRFRLFTRVRIRWSKWTRPAETREIIAAA